MKAVYTFDSKELNWFTAKRPLPYHCHDLISDSPYCQSYDFNDVGSGNLVLYQLTVPLFLFPFILITYVRDIVLILY